MSGRFRTGAAGAVIGLLLTASIAPGSTASAWKVVKVSKIGGLGRVEVQGDVGAVLQRDEGTVAILDTSVPGSPKVIGRYDTARASLDGDLAFSHDGRWLFYARQTSNFDEEGVHVINVTEPSNPTLAYYLPAGGSYRIQYIKQGDAHWLVLLDAIDGLVVSRFEPTTGALVPVHVDPLPELKVGGPASAGLFYEPNDPMLGVPLLYVTTGKTGLQVFDYSDPSAPELLGTWDDVGLADVEVAATKRSRTVYAATEYWFDAQIPPEIVALDATKLDNISRKIAFGLDLLPAESTYVQGLDLVGNRLYAAHSAEGLVVFDTRVGRVLDRYVQSGARNEQAGVLASPYAMDVEAAGGHIYLTDAALGTLAASRR
jgi:hypothetical protein